MPLYLIEEPSELPVTVAAVKDRIRISFDDDDDDLEDMIRMATQHIDGRDGWLGRALVAQTWELRLSAFAGDAIALPLPPLISVESVKYFDVNDAEQTLSSDLYEVVGAGGFGKAKIALKSGAAWPVTYPRQEAVTIRFRAGYVETQSSPATGEVPAPIATAIKMLVGTLYENREDVVTGHRVERMPWGVEAMLAPYRVW